MQVARQAHADDAMIVYTAAGSHYKYTVRKTTAVLIFGATKSGSRESQGEGGRAGGTRTDCGGTT